MDNHLAPHRRSIKGYRRAADLIRIPGDDPCLHAANAPGPPAGSPSDASGIRGPGSIL